MQTLTKPKSKDTPMAVEPTLIEALEHVAIAATGGVAKYLNEYIKGNPFFWKLFFAKLAVCAFIGLVFSLFFAVYKSDYGFVASAVAGYAGTEIFDALVHAIAKKTGKTILGVELKFQDTERTPRKKPEPKD